MIGSLFALLIIPSCMTSAYQSTGLIGSHHSQSASLPVWRRGTYKNNHSDETLETALSNQMGGFLYRTSVFDKDELNTITSELSACAKRLVPETASSIAQHRMGTALPKTSPTVQILRDGSLSRLVKRVVGRDYKLCEELPIEVRTYEKVGASMAWHVDDVLYDSPQVEVIWTLENTSNCRTMWKQDGNVRAVETDPNAVVLLRAGGPLHCVTSLKWGRRVILKCAYASKEATFSKGLHTNQFDLQLPKKKRRRKR
jgi:hypothetical protein